MSYFNYDDWKTTDPRDRYEDWRDEEPEDDEPTQDDEPVDDGLDPEDANERTIYSRKQYLDGDCTFSDYYLSIADEVGVSFMRSNRVPGFVAALEAGDEHLNTIPLATWDCWGAWMVDSGYAHEAFRRRGDSLSKSGIVCVYKTAAIKAALAAMATTDGGE